MMDAAVIGVAGGDSGDLIGRSLTVRAGPAGLDPLDDSFAEATIAWRGIDLRPLSPVRVTVRRLLAGDIEIRFIRRTRRGGDGWDQGEVALAEDREAYEIDILRDGHTVRTLTVSQPKAVYREADQRTDFAGELPGRLSIAIAQIAARFGRGAMFRGTFDV